jgi:gliding motility-associated-like protein
MNYKKIILCLFLAFLSANVFAGHIAGGEIFYRYIGPSNNGNSSRYLITIRLFRECVPPPNPDPAVLTSTMPADVTVTIYNNTSPSTRFLNTLTVQRTGFQILSLSAKNPCIVNQPSICYQVGSFEFTQDLPNTAAGYIVAFQTCCRTYDIANVQSFPLGVGGSGNGEGATYSCEIPGTNAVVGANSSAVFSLKDTTLVCNFSPFTLDFSATDPDAGDSLSYAFCSAFDRGNTVSSAFPANGYSFPPFNTVTYTQGFSGTSPLGLDVTINPVTGMISGKAPGAGRYVVNVCITEWRNRQPIRQHRKDFTLIVANCSVVGAELKPSYITCDGFTLSFENESTSPGITSYLWDFGEKTGTTPTSTDPTPTHTYADTGTYTLKLKVTSAGGCQDSTTAPVRIYPEFKTDFNVLGTCVLNAYQFKDATTSKYGTIDSWRWNFGDSTTLADTAISKDSAWKYSSPRTTLVTLISTNSKGCIDTATKTVAIRDRPQLNLPFRDTLICSIDTLALRVLVPGTASVLWTARAGPNQSRILNPSTATPLVFPRDTTRYYVSINDNGCTNSDSVTVNVLQFITVSLRDTGICLTDTIQLRPVTDALSYQWTASTGEQVASVKYPLVRPLVDTRYSITANLGKCQASATMLAIVNPYPVAAAGADMSICFGTRVRLNGTVTGNSFTWSPAASLINENTLSPTAAPARSTPYILTVTNTNGCLKPVSDTVLVTVIQPIAANAGRDTIVLAGQPLQLQASGGTGYAWRPGTGLNDPNISNPIAILSSAIDSIIYIVRVSEGSCYSEDDVKVRIYKAGADILVPSAFTPNNDGRNDVVHATVVGIQKLNYFSIYNRWGQLVFTTPDPGRGWDGNFNGIAQPSGTYVYQAQGTDYKGSSVFRKGTLVLIR